MGRWQGCLELMPGTACIAKPFTPASLTRKVREMLGKALS
jgi:hypothetical protein